MHYAATFLYATGRAWICVPYLQQALRVRMFTFSCYTSSPFLCSTKLVSWKGNHTLPSVNINVLTVQSATFFISALLLCSGKLKLMTNIERGLQSIRGLKRHGLSPILCDKECSKCCCLSMLQPCASEEIFQGGAKIFCLSFSGCWRHRFRCRQIFLCAKDFCPYSPNMSEKHLKQNYLRKNECISFVLGVFL